MLSISAANAMKDSYGLRCASILEQYLAVSRPTCVDQSLDLQRGVYISKPPVAVLWHFASIV